MTGMTAWQASGGGGAGEQWMQVVGVAYIAKQSVRTSPAQMGPLKPNRPTDMAADPPVRTSPAQMGPLKRQPQQVAVGCRRRVRTSPAQMGPLKPGSAA